MALESKDRTLLLERFKTDAPLRIQIITSSDRAAAGVYEDVGGRRVEERLRAFFQNTGIPIAIESSIVPDEPDLMRAEIDSARHVGASIILTTGGTGVGPRDSVPDVVLAMADKVIPGVMEHIRLKYGAGQPNALLSRSVAALMGSTLVYTLPGRPKAVDEYLDEILKSIEHAICTCLGLDAH